MSAQAPCKELRNIFFVIIPFNQNWTYKIRKYPSVDMDFTMALFFLVEAIVAWETGDDGKCSPHWNDLGQFGELN